jgi:hypothetical protein
MPEDRADDLTANVFVTDDNASGTSSIVQVVRIR